MREYDDYDDQSIRLYTPVLQRVIILGAVVIAVPVVMWTITTFVRSYVARPKVPLLEHVASTNAPTRIPLIAAPPSPAPAPADQSATPQRAADAAARDVRDSSSTASLQAAPMQAPSAAIAPPPAAATGDGAPASIVRLPQARPADSAASSAASSSDRGIAWPNPNATSAPDFAGSRLAPPPPPPPPARTAAAEVLPANDPIRGPVPLPRHRPGIFAVAASSPGASSPGASSPGVSSPSASSLGASSLGASSPGASSPVAGGPVPLPRARPTDAPAEAANSVIEPAYGYRPGLDSDR
jgi:hypothetical protein